MARLSPQDLPLFLPETMARPDILLRGAQAQVLAGWVQYLVENQGEEFVRRHSSALLRAWDEFIEECWF